MPSYRSADQRGCHAGADRHPPRNEGPRIAEAMLSIVKIDLSSDLSSCQVFVSSMKDLAAAQEAVKVLKNGAGFLRRTRQQAQAPPHPRAAVHRR